MQYYIVNLLIMLNWWALDRAPASALYRNLGLAGTPGQAREALAPLQENKYPTGRLGGPDTR